MGSLHPVQHQVGSLHLVRPHVGYLHPVQPHVGPLHPVQPHVGPMPPVQPLFGSMPAQALLQPGQHNLVHPQVLLHGLGFVGQGQAHLGAQNGGQGQQLHYDYGYQMPYYDAFNFNYAIFSSTYAELSVSTWWLSRWSKPLPLGLLGILK